METLYVKIKEKTTVKLRERGICVNPKEKAIQYTSIYIVTSCMYPLGSKKIEKDRNFWIEKD